MIKQISRGRPAILFLMLCTLYSAGCSSSTSVVEPVNPALQQRERVLDTVVNLTILQLNDVYEITPIEGGKSGGIARVARIRKDLLAENPNTIGVLAGDFLSPSALGTAKVEGERLAGKQMVAALNTMGLDYVTFGNHEFDLKEADLKKRMMESDFQWISGNVKTGTGAAFEGALPYILRTFQNGDGAEVKIAILGVTLDATDKPYVQYLDPLNTIKAQVETLKDQVDVFLALSHLDAEQDIELAVAVPELDLIMGGHDHENMHLRRGKGMTPIAKADANARSVFIHELAFDTKTGKRTIQSTYYPVTDAIPDEPDTAEVVRVWVEKAFLGFRESGFEPEKVLVRSTEPLDGLEASVRNRSTRLTELIADGMLREVPEADLSIYNSGSIRIDDILPPSELTQYDVIRILPFGGNVVRTKMKGRLVDWILTQGEINKGVGGYLHYAGVEGAADGSWHIGGTPINPEADYTVVISDYLLTGLETNLSFLTRDNPDLEVMEELRDIRKVLRDELVRVYSGS